MGNVLFFLNHKGGGKEESGMRLGTHMQIMDIGSLRIKNVLNNLGAGEKTRQQPPQDAINKTKSTYEWAARVTACNSNRRA